MPESPVSLLADYVPCQVSENQSPHQLLPDSPLHVFLYIKYAEVSSPFVPAMAYIRLSNNQFFYFYPYNGIMISQWKTFLSLNQALKYNLILQTR